MSFRKRFKKLARKHLAHVTKAGKVLIPVATAAVSYFAGPIVGEAFAYGATRLQQKTAAASMRGKHMNRHELSQKARAIANRTFKYSQIGVGAGAIGSAVVAVGSGASALGTVGQTLLGQGGSKLAGLKAPAPSSSEFVTDSNLDSQSSSGVSGITTERDIEGARGLSSGMSSASAPYSAGSSGGGKSDPSFFESMLGAGAAGAAKALLEPKPAEKEEAGFLGLPPKLIVWIVVGIVVLSILSSGGSSRSSYDHDERKAA